jgi:cytochrome P450
MDASRPGHTARVNYDARLRQWFVFAYDDVRSGLVNEHLTPDRMHAFAERAPGAAIEALRQHAPWIISPALADYDWIRPVMQAGLHSAADTPSRQAVSSAAEVLLDSLIGEQERFDAVQYAITLSGWTLADFLGVDRSDSRYLISWAHDLMAFFNEPEITTRRTERMARSASEMVAYAQALRAERGEQARSGFLDLAAQSAAARGRVLDDESIGNITLPFLTGHIGVAHLVANAIWLLLTHGQWHRVADQPDLIPGAIAETLRFTPPVALAPRVAMERTTIAGHVVEAGQGVQLSLAAANRDPARFTHADRFDITRFQGGALGFGHGAHSCIAAGISRAQAAIGVQALLHRAPQLALDPAGDVRWSQIEGLRALETLPVRATSCGGRPR